MLEVQQSGMPVRIKCLANMMTPLQACMPAHTVAPIAVAKRMHLTAISETSAIESVIAIASFLGTCAIPPSAWHVCVDIWVSVRLRQQPAMLTNVAWQANH